MAAHMGIFGDVYATQRPNAPVNVFVHGGAWQRYAAKDYAFPAELFVNAGAHFVVLDFINVDQAGGSLLPTRPVGGSSPTAHYRACCVETGRARSRRWKRCAAAEPAAR